MRTVILSLILIILLPSIATANCDLQRFRWDCDISMQPKPSRYAQSLVYCGNIYGYVTPAQFEQLTHYHRRSINMVLTINGEYVDSPCVPARNNPYRD